MTALHMQTFRRFYQRAELTEAAETGWQLLLDGKPAKTQAGIGLAHHSYALMQAVAQEWQAQEKHIHFTSMPLTRLLTGALEMGEEEVVSMRQEVVNYGMNDMLCYQDLPHTALGKAQLVLWGAWLGWAERRFQQGWLVTHEITPLAQPESLQQQLKHYVAELQPALLLLCFVLTQALGSFILAMAVLAGECSAEQAVQAAWLEQEIQMQQWGQDPALMAQQDALRHQVQDVLRFQTLAGLGFDAETVPQCQTNHEQA